MRVCPTVEGSSSPLISHRIQVGDCLARQQANYHKCFRCVYRCKAADWEPKNQEGGAVMTPAGARGVPSKTVEVPAERPPRKPRSPTRRRRKAAPAAPAG